MFVQALFYYYVFIHVAKNQLTLKVNVKIRRRKSVAFTVVIKSVSLQVAFLLLLCVVSLVKTGCISDPQCNPQLHLYLILRQNLGGV